MRPRKVVLYLDADTGNAGTRRFVLENQYRFHLVHSAKEARRMLSEESPSAKIGIRIEVVMINQDVHGGARLSGLLREQYPAKVHIMFSERWNWILGFGWRGRETGRASMQEMRRVLEWAMKLKVGGKPGKGVYNAD